MNPDAHPPVGRAKTSAGLKTDRRAWEPIELGPLPAMPLVSVLINNYNYAPYIGRAIDSVLSQTYQHIEAIVVDDGSTDGSPRIISAYQRGRHQVTLIEQPNGGQASALNTAFSAARGDVICLLDSDDWFDDQKVASVVRSAHEDPAAGLICHPLIEVDNRARYLGIRPANGLDNGWIALTVSTTGGYWRSPATSGICLRRELAARVFPIPESSFRVGADWFIFTLSPLLSPVKGLPEPLGFYRIHGSNRFATRLGQTSIAVSDVTNPESVTTGIQLVNQRLVAIGHPERVLDGTRNWPLQRRIMLADLVGARIGRAGLIRRWLKLLASPRSTKFGGSRLFALTTMGAAIWIPRGSRLTFIELAHRFSSARIPRKLYEGLRHARINMSDVPPPNGSRREPD